MDLFLPQIGKAIDFLLRRDYHIICLHAVYVIFLSFSLFLALHHTPGRDEAQAWLLARDLNVWELFKEARHDGHPILWHLCLKLIQATGSNYLGMMVLNWAFMAFAIGLLFYRSTLPLLARIAVALCPTCLLQISFEARNYAISAAFIFLAAALYRNAEKRPMVFCVVLALLGNTNVYAAAVLVGLSFQFWLEQAFSFGKSSFSVRPIYSRYLVPNLILLGGMLLLVAQLAPVPLAGEPTVGRPTLSVHFSSIGPLLWLLLLVSMALTLFLKCPGCPRIFGNIPTAVLVLIPALLYACNPRHAFMIVLEMVYFVWIYLDDFIRSNELEERAFGAIRSKTLVTLLIITVCLACQPAGLRTAFREALHNGSLDSMATAQAIIKNHLDEPDTLMVTTNPNKTTSLLMLLKNIRRTYAPPPFGPESISFADWFLERMNTHVPSLEELKPLVLEVARANPSKTIMVVSVDPKNAHFDDHDPNYHLVPVYSSPAQPAGFDIPGELYQVYLLKTSP